MVVLTEAKVVVVEGSELPLAVPVTKVEVRVLMMVELVPYVAVGVSMLVVPDELTLPEGTTVGTTVG